MSALRQAVDLALVEPGVHPVRDCNGIFQGAGGKCAAGAATFDDGSAGGLGHVVAVEDGLVDGGADGLGREDVVRVGELERDDGGRGRAGKLHGCVVQRGMLTTMEGRISAVRLAKSREWCRFGRTWDAMRWVA